MKHLPKYTIDKIRSVSSESLGKKEFSPLLINLLGKSIFDSDKRIGKYKYNLVKEGNTAMIYLSSFRENNQNALWLGSDFDTFPLKLSAQLGVREKLVIEERLTNLLNSIGNIFKKTFLYDFYLLFSSPVE